MRATQPPIVREPPRLRRLPPRIRFSQNQPRVRARLRSGAFYVQHENVGGSLLVRVGRGAAPLVLELPGCRHSPELGTLPVAFVG